MLQPADLPTEVPAQEAKTYSHWWIPSLTCEGDFPKSRLVIYGRKIRPLSATEAEYSPEEPTIAVINNIFEEAENDPEFAAALGQFLGVLQKRINAKNAADLAPPPEREPEVIEEPHET